MQIRSRFFLFALATGSLAAALSQGCGSNGGSGSSNNTGGSSTGSNTSTTGSGGATTGSGGATTGSGGATTGSGGATTGSGGATTGSGGATTGSGGATTGSGGATTGSGGATTGSGGMSIDGGVIHPIVKCLNQIYDCGDGIDNDGDGLIDSDDPDCLGPCDNSEDSYFPKIPGLTGPKCDLDCFFDADSGSGNDDCFWNHKCDPHEVSPDYYPESWNGAACAYDPNANISGTAKTCDDLYNAQSQSCYDYCGPLTPNGCDCFGCCELPAGGGKYVWLGSEDGNGNGSCDLAHVGDPTKCEPCMPVKACLNTCGHCELCIGKDTLPPDCFPPPPPDGGSTSSSASSGVGGSTSSSTTSSGVGGSTSSSTTSSSSSGGFEQCSAGIQPCGLPGQPPCPAGEYCITGCCQVIPQ